MKNLITILLILPFFSAYGQTETPKTSNARVHRYVDTARPTAEIRADFPYDISLRNAEGDTLLSNEILEKNGKPTVLMFWLTTCAPCRYELKAISAKYAGWQIEADFNLYAVSMDFPRNFENFQKRVDESQWPFPAYHDTNREFRKIMPGNLNGLPQVFVLNAEGEITYHKRKYMLGDEDKLFKAVSELANGQK